MQDGFRIRKAEEKDASLVVEFTRKLGKYQKMLDKVIITEEEAKNLIRENAGEAIFGEMDGEAVAFIYYYMSSSAFNGGRGIYIDAFYVNEELRGQGIGKMMMKYMASLAVKRGCKRIEWVCLDWNEPSIKFYKNLGADSMDIMTVYRMSPEIIEELSSR